MTKPTTRVTIGLLSFAVACCLGYWSAPLLAQAPEQKSPPTEALPRIAGVWRGRSECAVANSPCREEVNVYRISDVAGKLGWFSVTGSKVVDGKEIVMGTSDWKYQTESHMLANDSPAGSFKLIVDGDGMRGTLTLKDGTVYRRIELRREN